jgi:MFS family permease
MGAERMTRAARRLIVGRVTLAVGNGLVVPLTLIYLHQVRGIPLAVIGTLFAAMAVMSLAVVPFAGALLDRVGARPVLVAAIAGQALAAVGLVWVDNTVTACASCCCRARPSGRRSRRSACCWPGSTTTRSGNSEGSP